MWQWTTKNLQSILQSAEFDEVYTTWTIWPWHESNVQSSMAK